MAGGFAGLDVLGAPGVAEGMAAAGKRVLLLFLSGGSSQFETWDPKPGRSTGGPFQAIQTSIPGYRMCELMPRMANRIHKSAVIRSFSSPNVGHTGPSVNAILSGDRRDVPGLRTPSLGCLLARELSRPGAAVPDHIALYDSTQGFNGDSQKDFASFFGSRYQPINILRRLSPDDNQLPRSVAERDYHLRESLRQRLAAPFQAARERDTSLASHAEAYNRVRGMMNNADLFDASKEPQHVRDRYGPSLFGRQAIVARRLIEAGVPFVRLNHGWWDAHGENFELHSALVPSLDKIMSTLLDDLEQRGLLDDTLFVTFAEMGRTPLINTQRGRDHWGRCWSVTLTGCGIKPGVVHGSTNADGTDVATDRVTTAEFFATIFQAVGIDPHKEYLAPDGRPIHLTPSDAQPVAAVLA